MKNAWLMFVVGSSILAAFGTIAFDRASTASAAEPQKDSTVTAYIGGYASAKNKGIYRITLNTADGTLSTPTLAVEAKNASFLANHPTLRVLYAAGEASKPNGNVKAFRINDDGTLVALGEQSSHGDGPCYVGVDPQGQLLLTANYGDGVIAGLPLAQDGSIGAATFVEQDVGSSVVAKRQEGPHAHSFISDPSGRFAVSADLGTDEVAVYAIDGQQLKHGSKTKLPPGSGPRHIAFTPDGKFVYVCNELSNTLASFAFDAGVLKPINLQSTLPADYKGESACAEVAMHPSGRFLYVSNRGSDTLAVFAIDATTGRATAVGHVSTGGHWPRHFAIEPGGNFLIVANQRSDSLVAFRIDLKTGLPSPTGSTAEIGQPSCVRFVR